MKELDLDDPYKYPNDGRGASDSPGLWTEVLSFLPNEIPWENFVPQLNGPFDRWVSRHVITKPWSPLAPVLQILFGRRGG